MLEASDIHTDVVASTGVGSVTRALYASGMAASKAAQAHGLNNRRSGIGQAG